MRKPGRNSRFFSELTPLNDKLVEIRKATPQRLSEAKDWHECHAKQSAKLARRAARAKAQQGAVE